MSVCIYIDSCKKNGIANQQPGFRFLFSNHLCANELTSYFIFAKFFFFGIRKISMVEYEEQNSYAFKIIFMQPWSSDLLAVYV
jgi:hypothetical protein